MQLTPIVFLVMTIIPPLVAGVGEVRPAKTGNDGSVEINVFMGQYIKQSQPFSAAWLPGIVPYEPKDGVITFEPREGYGFYVDKYHSVFRRQGYREDHKFEDIVDYLYAKTDVVTGKKRIPCYPQKLFCFLDGEDPGPEYTPVKLDVDLSNTGLSSAAAPYVPRNSGGISSAAAPYGPSRSRSELSGDAPCYFPKGARRNPRRTVNGSGEVQLDDFANLGI